MIHKIRDIEFSEQFIDDYTLSPEHIQTRMDQKVNSILDGGILPPAVQAHRVHGHEYWWIGYCSMGKGGWRFLFSFPSAGLLRVERLLKHEDMLKFLRSIS